MNTNDGARPVVVGYDSNRAGDGAFDWARAEAERRQLPLTLLVARGVLYAAAPGMGAAAPWPEGMGNELVDEARKYGADRAGEVPLKVESALGSASALLVDASSEAELVVVGRQPHSALGEAIWGSTSTQVVAHAHCPVVVVDRPCPESKSAPIVVGVDGSKEGQAALEFAFHRAWDLHAPVVAVHAWWIDVPDHLTAGVLSGPAIDGIESAARTVLDDTVAPWMEKFPDVRVRKALRRMYATNALLDEADGAQLIVVGSRGHGGFAGLLLGSVSQGLLHQTERACPLAVVHTGR